MLQEAIYKFKASGPMLLPDLIDNYWIERQRHTKIMPSFLMKYISPTHRQGT